MTHANRKINFYCRIFVLELFFILWRLWRFNLHPILRIMCSTTFMILSLILVTRLHTSITKSSLKQILHAKNNLWFMTDIKIYVCDKKKQKQAKGRRPFFSSENIRCCILVQYHSCIGSCTKMYVLYNMINIVLYDCTFSITSIPSLISFWKHVLYSNPTSTSPHAMVQ